MIDVKASALFSGCGRYRIWLRRIIGNPLFTLKQQPCVWTFLPYNPSQADGVRNDPSVRRMIDFAERGGATEAIVANIMTAVGTDPDSLAALDDPVGPMADEAIMTAARLATASGGLVIAAWGVPKGKTRTREIAAMRMTMVRQMLAEMDIPLRVLRLTASGYPEHPLYLPKNLTPQLWPAG